MKFFIAVSLVSLLIVAGTFFVLKIYKPLTRVDEFRTVRVGQINPGFGAVSSISKINIDAHIDGTVEIGSRKDNSKFYIHFINDQLKPVCLDLECGEAARHVISKGGRLIGKGNGKAASSYGIEITPRPYKYDASIMVVTDSSSRITAIYENAYLDDIPDVLEELGL